jgi:hypothetical protein
MIRRHVMRRLARSTFVVVAAVAATGRASAQPREVRCEYTQRIECSGAGCRPVPVGSGYLQMPDTAALLTATARAGSAAALPTIKVCDAGGCAPIVVRAGRSGAFVNIAQHDGAHFVKVAVADVAGASGAGPGIRKGDFLEVAAQFLGTVTHVGRCPALVR